MPHHDPEDILLVEKAGQLRNIIKRITSRYSHRREGGEGRLLIETQLDASHSLAKVHWRLLRGDGAEIVSFDVTYLLRMAKEGSAIILLMPHNEEERFREKELFE